MARKWVAGRALVGLVAAACATGGGQGEWAGRDTVTEAAHATAGVDAPGAVSPAPKVIALPPATSASLQQFVDRRATLMADVVEVDASRDVFLSATGIVASPETVRRTEEEDYNRGVLTITLVRDPSVPAVPDSLPTARFGGGLQLVGVDRIVLRYWSRESSERPAWFAAVGSGKAVLRVAGQASKDLRGERVELRADVALYDGAYRFDEAAEARP